MEYRSQTAALRVLSLAGALAAAGWGQDLQFAVRHERAMKDHPGRVTFGERGVEYQQVPTAKQRAKVEKGGKPPKLESARWDYLEIQQLWLSPEKLVIVTYRDRPWFLGVDKEFEFYPAERGQPFTAAYEFLKGKLDQRFVAALADPKTGPLWEMPAKLLGTLRGSEGMLRVSADRVVFETARKEQSRTWRFADIENVSTSGPFQLTLTTYERAKTHYGSLKGFHFQLKQRLDEKRFERLWRDLNQDRSLEFLTSLRDQNETTR